MSIRVTCELCGHRMSVGNQRAGKRGRCPECGGTIDVPAAGGRAPRKSSSSSRGRRRKFGKKTGSQQNTLLVVGGSLAGVTIVVLIAVVAYLAGRSGDAGTSPSPPTTVADAAPPETVRTNKPAQPKPVPSTPIGAAGAKPAVIETATAASPKTNAAMTVDPVKTVSNPPPTSGKRFSSVADLIEAVEPSVCRIDVESSEGSSTGSGFVMDAGGIIATNYHVIAGALRASVTFPDGASASIEGTVHLDPKKDIALIKIEPPKSSLTPVALAGELPRKGEVLVAIGTPLGLDFSASEGKVSAIRTEEELKTFGAVKKGTWIQSTAPISPGNSGGPLFNMRGEVVAANTMTLTIGQNLNFGISAGDIAAAFEKRASQAVALSPKSVPVVAETRSSGRRKPIDGTSSDRGRDLLAGLSEVQLLVGTFSFDPTGNVEKYVVRMAENTLDQADLENRQTNAALMMVLMKFEGRGRSSRARSLVIEAHIVVRDKNELVTVWKDHEKVGSFSQASFIQGKIPQAVRTKVVKFFKRFRSSRRKAINERKKEAE